MGHCYISGHINLSKQEILVEDMFVFQITNYTNTIHKKFKEITDPAGTIVFGDTGCWHKGKPIENGDRLLLQLEYTSSYLA